MRLLIVLAIVALLSLDSAAITSAQTVRQPGQLGVSFQVGPGGGVEQYSASALPKTSVASVEDPHDRFVNRLWIASMIAAVAGTSFDAGSSRGQVEANGLLASSDGRFGAKGLGIKAGFAAATIIPQICLRKHKALKGPFAFGNFAEAAIFTGVSVHNLQVRNATNH
jgi:hypothetical protein